MNTPHSQNKVQIIICSYNRAMQLEALLDSIRHRWMKTAYELVVLYETNADEYEKGYEIVKDEYPEYCFICRQKCWPLYPLRNYFNVYNLKLIYGNKSVRFQSTNVRQLIVDILKNTECKYCMFSSDDEEFIDDVDLSGYFHYLDEDPANVSLSLTQSTWEKPFLMFDEKVYKWKKSDFDYGKLGYRYNFDVNVMDSVEQHKLLSKIIFNNPSSQESNVGWYCYLYGGLNTGVSLKHGLAINHRLNLVQENYQNKAVGVSVANLNSRFLDGYRLRYLSPINQEGPFDYPDKVRLMRNGEEQIVEVGLL